MIEIALLRGYSSNVSDVDEDLTAFKWTVKDNQKWVYVYRNDWNRGKQKNVYIHRVILERIVGRALLFTDKCDHIDGNGLNNCRDNIRLATNTQNAQNMKRKTNSSGFKGVSYFKPTGKWVAQIRVNGARIGLGYFSTPELAYDAYCDAANRYFGRFARYE